MNRRRFLKSLLGAAAVAVVPVTPAVVAPVRFTTKWVDGRLVLDGVVRNISVIETDAGSSRCWAANVNNYNLLRFA